MKFIILWILSYSALCFEVVHPTRTKVGIDIPVTLDNISQNHSTVHFVISNGLIQKSFKKGLSGSKKQALLIPKKFNFLSGYNSLYIRIGDQVRRSQIFVAPGQVKGFLEFQITPKTQTVGGDRFWAFSLPVDRFQNSVKDETRVMFWFRPPRGDVLKKVSKTTRAGVAFHSSHTTNKTGKWQISSTSGSSRAIEQRLRQIADEPSNLAIKVAKDRSQVDGLYEVKLESHNVIDRFGNPMPDGSVVTFQVSRNGKIFAIIPSVIAGGSARTRLFRPSSPGRYSVKAYAHDQQSNEVLFHLDSPLNKLPKIGIEVLEDRQQLLITMTGLAGSFGQWLHQNQSMHLDITYKGNHVFSSVLSISRGKALQNVNIAGWRKGGYTAKISFGGIDTRRKFVLR